MKRAMSWLLFLAMLFALAASFAEQAENAEALPESFDLRNVDTDGDGVGDRCYVPPVRQQGPFGTCWGFSVFAGRHPKRLSVPSCPLPSRRIIRSIWRPR